MDKVSSTETNHVREANCPDASFHAQTLFDVKKVEFAHPLAENKRVTALVAIDIVRNGYRQGNLFITDQNEVFDITQVADWRSK